MKCLLAAGFLWAGTALPVHAEATYVPYVADEVVGTARYRTEVLLVNHGESPAQVRTIFVSADGARHPVRTTTVPADTNSYLTAAAPTGARGYLEVAGPVSVSARLLGFGSGARLLSSVEERVIPADELVPAGRTIYLRANSGLFEFNRLGVVTVGGLGSCSFATSDKHHTLGPVSVIGSAMLARDLAERVRALHLGSNPTAWLTVTCDRPTYIYAAMLTTDGSHIVLESCPGSGSQRRHDSSCDFTASAWLWEHEGPYYDPPVPLEELKKIPVPQNPYPGHPRTETPERPPPRPTPPP